MSSCSFSRKGTCLSQSPILGVRVWVALHHHQTILGSTTAAKLDRTVFLSRTCTLSESSLGAECSDTGQCICVDRCGRFLQFYRLHLGCEHTSAWLWGPSLAWVWMMYTQHQEYWRESVRVRLFNHCSGIVKHIINNIHARHHDACAVSRYVNSYKEGIGRRGTRMTLRAHRYKICTCNDYPCVATITCILDDSGIAIGRRGKGANPREFPSPLIAPWVSNPQRRNAIELSIISMNNWCIE